MKYVIIIFFFPVLFSCQDNHVLKEKKDIKPVKSYIQIDTLFIPKIEIDDCSCRLSKDSIDFYNEKYILFNNCVEFPKMKINGSVIQFRDKSYKEFNKKSVQINFTSEKYNITIHFSEAEAIGKLSAMVSGTITVFYNNDSLQQKIYGKCGYQ